MRIEMSHQHRASTVASLRSDRCRELLSAGELEVLSTTKFVGWNVEELRMYT